MEKSNNKEHKKYEKQIENLQIVTKYLEMKKEKLA